MRPRSLCDLVRREDPLCWSKISVKSFARSFGVKFGGLCPELLMLSVPTAWRSVCTRVHLSRTVEILRSLLGEEIVEFPEVYGDGDLSLTSTPLVDEIVPSTQSGFDTCQRIIDGSTAYFGAVQREQINNVTDTRCKPRLCLVVGSSLWLQDISESCFVSPSLWPHPWSFGPRVRPGTYEVSRPTRRRYVIKLSQPR